MSDVTPRLTQAQVAALMQGPPDTSYAPADQQPKSIPEEVLAAHLRALGLEPFCREYRFHPTRQWRLDFAWPDHMLAVEIEGGIHSRGRHVRPAGFANDIDKYNAAAVAGWSVLRFTPAMVRQGKAARMIEEVLHG
jgi:very-short-patch-repair endonuclease